MSSHVRMSDGIVPPPGPVPSHAHPLSPFLTTVLVVDLVLVLLLGLFTLREIVTAADRVARQSEQVRADVLAEINRRSAARDAQQAAERAQTNRIVCQVLDDLPPAASTRALQQQLGCAGP